MLEKWGSNCGVKSFMFTVGIKTGLRSRDSYLIPHVAWDPQNHKHVTGKNMEWQSQERNRPSAEKRNPLHLTWPFSRSSQLKHVASILALCGCVLVPNPPQRTHTHTCTHRAKIWWILGLAKVMSVGLCDSLWAPVIPWVGYHSLRTICYHFKYKFQTL